MKQDRTVKAILHSLKVAREASEESLRECTEELRGHIHNIFCFNICRCRKVEKEITKLKKRIKEFREAEKGLARGKCSKAIELLGRTSEQINMQIIIQTEAVPPTLNEIVDKSSAIAYSMRQARDYLINLQPSYQE